MIKFIFSNITITVLVGTIRIKTEAKILKSDDCLHWGSSRGIQEVTCIVVDMGEREYGLKRDQVKLPGHSDLLHM